MLSTRFVALPRLALLHTAFCAVDVVELAVGEGLENEVMRCIRQAEEGDPANERFLLEYLPIVRQLARNIRRRLPENVDVEDLESAGVIGLIDAMAKFDPSKKVEFGCYARFRIRGAILDSLRSDDWSSRELRRKGRVVEEAIQVLTAALSRPPDEAEVAAKLGLAIRAYQRLRAKLRAQQVRNLHDLTHEDSGEELLASLPARQGENPLFQCMHGQLKDRLSDALSNLPYREERVLVLYYYDDLSMREIAERMDVSVARVSQMHSSALARLRVGLNDLEASGSLFPSLCVDNVRVC